MANTFYKKISEEKISVVGQPALNPSSMDIKKDIKFDAVFEVYPEFTLKSSLLLNIKNPLQL